MLISYGLLIKLINFDVSAQLELIISLRKEEGYRNEYRRYRTIELIHDARFLSIMYNYSSFINNRLSPRSSVRFFLGIF